MTPTSVLDCRDVEALCRAVASGKRAKYLFFWSHRSPTHGAPTPNCLSQWFRSPFAIEGEVFHTAEHYMMAEKARLFDDLDARERILNSRQPGAAKRIGREVRGFDNDVWLQNRYDIVVAGNELKFRQNEDLRIYLLGTIRRVIVEASPVDRVWGIGIEADDLRSKNPLEWRGQNLLGFALMEVRSRLVVG